MSFDSRFRYERLVQVQYCCIFHGIKLPCNPVRYFRTGGFSNTPSYRTLFVDKCAEVV